VNLSVQGLAEPVADAGGEVFEDGSRHASGQLTPPPGVDPEAALTWTVTNPSVIATPEYRFSMDFLSIVRNGSQYFLDEFTAGGPPPQAANLNVPPPNGTSYFMLTGSTMTEVNGRAILDGSQSAPIGAIGSTDPFHGHLATLNTDTSPDLSLGLKIDDDFTVLGRFDLVIPETLEAYGVRVADVQNNDTVDLRLRMGTDGILSVVLRDVDAPAGVQTTLGSVALPALDGENQIALRLTHAAADPGTIHASFDLLRDGVFSRSFTLDEVGHIFGTGTPGNTADDEAFTRAQFIATSPSDRQNGAYGTLTINNEGEWSYALDNSLATVQALAQGEHASDVFNISVSDGLGGTATKTLSVDVVGSNDIPTIFASFP